MKFEIEKYIKIPIYEPIIIEELLEAYAETFISLNVQRLLGITFKQFLTWPDHYIVRANKMIQGDGVLIQDNMKIAVELS
jgi:hypothetical protein